MGATGATTGAMQLALPACGDGVAYSARPEETCTLKKTPPTSGRARIAPDGTIFAEGDTFASGGERRIRDWKELLILWFALRLVGIKIFAYGVCDLLRI